MTRVLLLCCAALASPIPTLAAPWGPEGHRIVCEIAWLRLSDRGRALVRGLLGPDADARFADSCNWADEVRATTHRYTATYHYVNIPSGTAGLDLARDCGDVTRRCVTWAIAHYALVLADPAAPLLQRQEALKFLGHFVGDLHQPLHAGRPGDRGGNDVLVGFFGVREDGGRPLNLHWTWDTMILGRMGLTWPDAARRLAAQRPPEGGTAGQRFHVIAWTNESYRICEELVYALPARNAIGDDYFRRATPVIERRLAEGGMRLAQLINQAAAGAPQFPPALEAIAAPR